ncbi:YbbR-like protein [bacterium BMS3Bbin14]|nr:YbbR-like protein [bacterium BMS3Abin13]GBE51810.1 YbbR-like protein [bacterium BMS3Bbin14]HDO30764.1 hypothetical protein [Desulfobacteraceae bacterium]HDZ76058.1 hypothetical protein [Desulfobacteraceae bacterium]
MEKLARQVTGLMKIPTIFKKRPKNWVLKCISLALSVLLWYFVVGEEQVDMNVLVPLEILNLPSDLIISNQYKKDIEVSVRGSRSIIQDLRNRNITRPVDLSDAKPGTIVIHNDENSIPFPSGVKIQRLQPTNITLLLDKLVQKDFPIVPVTEGEVAPGYVLKKIYLTPDHLVISGPKTILDQEASLKTYLINLDGLDRSTTLQIHLNLRPEFLDLIGETVVTAKLEVHDKMEERTVKNIPINVREAGVPVTVHPDSVTVTASIPKNLIRDTPELAMLLRASVSAKDIHSSLRLPVTVSGVNVPGHDPIKILSVRPTEVIVTPILQANPGSKKNGKTNNSK